MARIYGALSLVTMSPTQTGNHVPHTEQLSESFRVDPPTSTTEKICPMEGLSLMLPLLMPCPSSAPDKGQCAEGGRLPKPGPVFLRV